MPHKDPVVRQAYLNAYKRKFRARWAEHQRAYDSAKHANDRAERFGVAGCLTTQEVFDLLHDAVCAYCGSSAMLGIDHVEPMSNGGVNLLENVVVACRSCNASKYQQDRPGRWSRLHESCVECGTTFSRHQGHGRCNRCYIRHRKDMREITETLK